MVRKKRLEFKGMEGVSTYRKQRTLRCETVELLTHVCYPSHKGLPCSAANVIPTYKTGSIKYPPIRGLQMASLAM